MTRTFVIVMGAGIFLAVNVTLVIWIVILGMIKEFRERKVQL